MKAYVITTGSLFGLLVLLHVWRIIEEGSLLKEPFYILITTAAAVLCLWAVRVYRLMPR